MKMMVCRLQTICSPHFLSMKPSQRYCKDVNTFSLTLFYEKIKWTGSRYFHGVVGMFEVEMCFVQCPVEVQCSLSVILLRCVNLMSFNSLEYGVLTPRTPPLLYFPPLLTPSYMVQNNFFVWLNGFLVNLDFIMKQSWSPELATVAQRWANTCREGHNPRRSSSSYRNLGENIYRRTGNALSCSKTYW